MTDERDFCPFKQIICIGLAIFCILIPTVRGYEEREEVTSDNIYLDGDWDTNITFFIRSGNFTYQNPTILSNWSFRGEYTDIELYERFIDFRSESSMENIIFKNNEIYLPNYPMGIYINSNNISIINNNFTFGDGYDTRFGMLLPNKRNILIANNTFTNFRNFEIELGTNITFINNTFISCWHNFLVEDTRNITIKNNTFIIDTNIYEYGDYNFPFMFKNYAGAWNGYNNIPQQIIDDYGIIYENNILIFDKPEPEPVEPSSNPDPVPEPNSNPETSSNPIFDYTFLIIIIVSVLVIILFISLVVFNSGEILTNQKENKQESFNTGIIQESIPKRSRNDMNKEIELLKNELNLSFDSTKYRDKEIKNKIKEIMEVSSKIRLDLFKSILKLDERIFSEKIINWAKRFGFKLDGDFIIFENADIHGFIEDLDNQFKLWERNKK